MNEPTLTPAPIENLAKPLIGLAGKILSHYKNPEHEKSLPRLVLMIQGIRQQGEYEHANLQNQSHP